MRTTACGAALLALALAHGSLVRAAPRAGGKGRAQASLEEVAIMLAASDEEELRTALESAATLPPRDVLPLLEERVRAGLTHELLEVALDTLLLLADPGSTPLLVELAQHRRASIRIRALDALGRIKGAGAEQALVRGLGDLDPGVRKAAAEALGELGASSAFAPLTRAIELGVDGAPRALGRVASARDVPRLIELIGTRPLEVLTPLFEALFARRDIAEAEKLRVVEAIAARGGEDAQAQLTALASTLPPDASAQLRKALAQPTAGAQR